MNPINILIADDHPIFLKGLREVIETGGHNIVYQAINGAEALEGILSKQPDVVILDIDMPVMNGLQAAQEALSARPDLAVILLTMHKVKDAFMKALETGVMGYVLKENAVTDIMQAIQSVAAGNAYISPEMSAFLLRQKQKPLNAATADLSRLLTPAERKVLQGVAAYKSSREIAEELFISEKTVSNHRMNITRKLSLTGKNSLLRFAIEASAAAAERF